MHSFRKFFLTFFLKFMVAITVGVAYAEEVVYVTNSQAPFDLDYGTVSMLRASDLTLLKTIRVGSDPTDAALHPNGQTLWVPSRQADTVSVINTASFTVMRVIDVEAGAHPTGIAITPDGAYAYVTLFGTGEVIIIDTATYDIVPPAISVSATPTHIVFLHDGSKAYVVDYQGTMVSVIRTSDNTVIKDLDFDGRTLQDAVVSSDDSLVYVANRDQQQIELIRTSDDSKRTPIATEHTWPRGIEISLDGDYLFTGHVLEAGDGVVDMMRLSDNTMTSSVAITQNPRRIRVSADGSRIFVIDHGSGECVAYDVVGETLTQAHSRDLSTEAGHSAMPDGLALGDYSAPSLEIIDPTQDRPARGLSPTNQSRVLVRLRASDGLDLSLPNLNVAVDGGELATAQIPIYSVIEDETWLVIDPGPRPIGCYDLEVSLDDDAEVTAKAPESLCYDDIETVVIDRVVAVDRTNSMLYDSVTGVANDEKMVAAQDAASHFVGLSNDQDGIGLVSFQLVDANADLAIEESELAQVEQPLTIAEVDGMDRRPAVRLMAESIEPSPGNWNFPLETSIGAAILTSKAALDASDQAGSDRVIVLVTDGRENYPPYWTREGGGGPLRPAIIESGVVIHTVAIGQDAEYEVLADIADSTEGSRYSQPEGDASYSLLSRLTSVFKSIDEDIRGEQRFYYREGVPTDLAHGKEFTREGRFTVEPFLDWMTVSFHWAPVPSSAGVELYARDGTLVPALSLSDDKHTIYRVLKPEAGEWSYRVPSSISADGEFTAIASGPTLLSAQLRIGETAESSGGTWSTPLRIWIAEDVAVGDAEVTATIIRPDRTKASFTLRDDGASADGAASDGVYGFVVEETIPGAYHVEVVARGEFGDAQPFERYLTESFGIPGRPAPPLPPFGEGRPGGGPCDGPIWCCWIWAAFVLAYIAVLLASLRLICFYRDRRLAASTGDEGGKSS